MDIREIKAKISKELGISPLAIDVFEKDGKTFALSYNSNRATKAITDKDIENMKKLEDLGCNKIYRYFANNNEICDKATDFVLHTGNAFNFDAMVEYINKALQIKQIKVEDETVLDKCGKIECFDVSDGQLPNDSVAYAQVLVQNIGRTRRCFVDEIKTDSDYRHMGLASRILNSFLPKLCAFSDISNIVAQVGAFDVDDERITQTRLLEFYKKCGFYTATERDNISCLSEDDFNDGYPVVVKPVDYDRYL